jgi:hypothetical protein
MKRLVLAFCLSMAGGTGMGLAAHPAFAASLCVGSGPGCFQTIQAALNAANDGDVIQIGPGTFAGGITITVSVSLVGAGAAKTTIKGGGPVVTIGDPNANSQPTVGISGVTITEGSNTVSPAAFVPQGGGLSVVPAAGFTTGATVTITNSVITGNSIAPSASGDCGGGCRFSIPLGGGIFNAGRMTLTNTVVSDNTASNANATADFAGSFGGGIENDSPGSLTLRGSTVSGNRILVTTAGANNLFAFGGGVDSGGPLTVDDSNVSNNQVTGVGSNANADIFLVGGGVHIAGTATIHGSQIVGNRVTMTNVGGFVAAFSGGIDDDGSLVLTDSLVKDNQATATITAPNAPPGSASQGTNGAMEIDGSATIRDTTFVGNRAVATSVSGDAAVGGGAIFNGSADRVTITGSTITDNHAIATASVGNASVGGSGILNSSLLTLRDTVVSKNTASATAPNGTATTVGAGIFNTRNSDGRPVAQLTLIDSAITKNGLTASGLTTTVLGAGLFNDTASGATVTLTNSVIAQNSPDQCFGC